MDDDEDFKALFFSEARELLDSLQEHLNLLAEDEGDSDTVHAAFRAVHSVKGGAAAFGFDTLISFAHIFETVMDLVREDRLAFDDELAQVLLRAGDMMQLLVEAAENGSDAEIDGLPRLQAELETLAGHEPEEPAAEAEAESAADEPDPEPKDEAPVEEAAEAATREYIYRITPEANFFTSGHDMLRLIKAGRAHGLAEVHVDGEVPTLDAFDVEDSNLAWELTFRTESTLEDLDAFFQIYSHTAQIELEGGDDDDEPDPDPPSGEEAPGAPAAPEQAAAPAATPAPAANGASGAGGGDSGPPPPKESAQRGPEGRGAVESSKSLRVEITRIDRLVNLVGEMLITQAALAQQVTDAEGPDGDNMAHAVDTMNRQLRELQESVMAIRAQPVKSVFRRMPRVVRDLSEKLDKQARLSLEGEYTEVDATVIEELTEPLTHMIRNAMDHGLEGNDEREALGKPRVGHIRLSAEHRGERVIITIEDDGRGVNRERVREKAIERGLITEEDPLSPEEIDMLIFHPGFSTAQEVSSVSGRGVGMDVVKKKIVSLGGRCALESNPGNGTRFVITLPLTLAVMDGMTIGVGDQKYILPLSTVVEALHVTRDTGKRLPDGTTMLERRGEYLRLISLRSALNLPQSDADKQMAIVVDTETSGHVALTVDELIGQRQIVLKSLEANFKKVDGISGATILGDGQVALILDVAQLMQSAGAGAPAFSEEMFH